MISKNVKKDHGRREWTLKCFGDGYLKLRFFFIMIKYIVL